MILYNDITYSFHRTEHGNPGLCPARVLMELVPFDQNPFLHLLRNRCVGVVRRLRRYYGSVRLPVFVHCQISSLDLLTRPTPTRGEHWLSRFSRSLFLYMHRFLTAWGMDASRFIDSSIVAFHILLRCRHPRVNFAAQ